MTRISEYKAITKRIVTGCGPLAITINLDEDGTPIEVLTHIGKSGGCASAQVESIGALITSILSNVEPSIRKEMMKNIIHQLKGIMCHRPTHGVKSCSDGIAIALEHFMKEGGVDDGSAKAKTRG